MHSHWIAGLSYFAIAAVSFFQLGNCFLQLSPIGFRSRFVLEVSSLSGDELVDKLNDSRLWLNFDAFGFSNRTCQLDLLSNSTCVYSNGFSSGNSGVWRIEKEDGEDYLQFTCPLNGIQAELFEVPSALLFWRGQINQAAEDVKIADGLIISEKKILFGLRSEFVNEGNFTARVLKEDEAFPPEQKYELNLSELTLEDDDKRSKLKKSAQPKPSKGIRTKASKRVNDIISADKDDRVLL